MCLLLLRGKQTGLKHTCLLWMRRKEGKEKEFEMSAELISALLLNDSRTSLAVIQTVVLF